MKQLRDYQAEANTEAKSHCRASTDPFLMVLSVGSGKTLMIADLAKHVTKLGGSVLVLTHQEELLIQNADEAWLYFSDYDKAKPSMLAGQKFSGSKFPLFAMRQTLVNRLDIEPYKSARVDLIVVDEAHTFDFQNPDSGAGKIYAHYKAINPKLRIIGLTGTPYRNNEPLYQNGFWQAKASKDITLRHQINEGWITDFHYGLHSDNEEIDFSSLNIRAAEDSGGNYSEEDFDRILQGEYMKTMEICHNVHRKAQQMDNGCLIFCGSKLHTEQVKLGLLKAGAKEESIAIVTDDTSNSDREAARVGAVNGTIKYFINVGVASTGWNVKPWEYIVYLRPIGSRTFFEQSLGRALRPFLDDEASALFNGTETTRELRLELIQKSRKPFAVVDDYAGVVERLGDTLEEFEQIVSAKDDFEKSKSLKCLSCESTNIDKYFRCVDCGHQMPPPKVETKQCGLCGHENSKHAIRCSNFYDQKNKDGEIENSRCLGFFISGEKYECKTPGCHDIYPDGRKVPTLNSPSAKQCRNCGSILSDPNAPLIGKAYRDNEYRAIKEMTFEIAKNQKGIVVRFILETPDQEIGTPWLYFHLDGSDMSKRVWYNEFVKHYVTGGSSWQGRARNMKPESVIKGKAMFNTPTHITVRKNGSKFVIGKRLFRSGRESVDETQNPEFT